MFAIVLLSTLKIVFDKTRFVILFFINIRMNA